MIGKIKLYFFGDKDFSFSPMRNFLIGIGYYERT